MKEQINIEEKKVRVSYCECGKTVTHVCALDYVDKEAAKEFGNAAMKGRKVETITLAEFKTKPFMGCECQQP